MKRRLGLLRSAVAAAALVTTIAAGLTVEATSDKKMAVILSPEGRGDLGWNDLAWRGAEMAKEKGYVGDYTLLVSSPTEILSLLTSLTESGKYDLILANSWAYVKSITEVANKHPKQNFAQMDTRPALGPGDPGNGSVLGLIFNQEQMSAMAGALAAFVAAQYDAPHVGVVLGREGAILHDFEVGYKWGVDWGVKWMQTNRPEVLRGKKFAATPATKRVLWTYVGTFGDPAKGKAAARVQLEQGAAVIYQVAGGTGLGVLGAVEDYHKERGGDATRPPYAIGVDADQDWINPYVIASGMKRVDLAVLEAARLVHEGKFRDTAKSVNGALAHTLVNGGVALSDEKILGEFLQFAIASRSIEPAKANAIVSAYKTLRSAQPAWFWPAVKELETKIKSGELIVPKPTADPAKFDIKKLREIYG